jgi:hypothetical protein
MLLSRARPARAEAVAPGRPPSHEAPDEAPDQAPDEARDDEAWTLYHDAFAALVARDVAGAARRLNELQARFPTHPASQRAAALARTMAGLLPAGPPSTVQLTDDSPSRPAASPPRNSNAARAELIIFQTLHGLALGTELCAVARCSGARPVALSLMLGGGAGLGLSVALTSGGISAGHTALLDAGVFWGAWNGLALSEITKDNPSDVYTIESMMIGQGVGLGLGALLWEPLHPTVGQVALVDTFSFWGTGLTLFALGAVRSNDGDASLWLPMILASDAGVVIGSIAARGRRISRGRTLLIDAGGFLGLLLGALSISTSSDEQSVFTSMLLGTGAGLGIATFATMHWDDGPPSPSAPTTTPHLAPMTFSAGGMGALLGGTF